MADDLSGVVAIPRKHLDHLHASIESFGMVCERGTLDDIGPMADRLDAEIASCRSLINQTSPLHGALDLVDVVWTRVNHKLRRRGKGYAESLADLRKSGDLLQEAVNAVPVQELWEATTFGYPPLNRISTVSQDAAASTPRYVVTKGRSGKKRTERGVVWWMGKEIREFSTAHAQAQHSLFATFERLNWPPLIIISEFGLQDPFGTMKNVNTALPAGTISFGRAKSGTAISRSPS